MRTVGIIAEYDPFHAGHAFQLEKAKEASGADYVVAAMSPDFLQRGEPALLDKWVRARMALEAGADLVLELPVRCAVGSAEFFAEGGVRLLHALGCIDALSFGCEAADRFGLLEQAARFLAAPEPEEYQALLKEKLRAGVSYPKARAEALAQVLGSEEIPEVLREPNNILAVEYRKAMIRLGSRMEAVPVRRMGAYHAGAEASAHQPASSSGTDAPGFASASAIRAALISNGMRLPEEWKRQLPASSLHLLEEELENRRYVLGSGLDLLLHRVLLERQEELETFTDIDEDLANRIRSLLNRYTGFYQFASLVHSKQYTLARIRRALLHVLLGIRKGDRETVSCARVLGFRKTAQPLLHEIRRRSSVPLSTSLPFPAIPKEDVDAAHLWEMILTDRTKQPLRHEQQRPLIVYGGAACN